MEAAKCYNVHEERPVMSCLTNSLVWLHKEETTSMKRLINSLVCLHKDEAGQGLIEYVLILALIAFAAVASMKVLASAISSAFSKVGSMLDSALS